MAIYLIDRIIKNLGRHEERRTPSIRSCLVGFMLTPLVLCAAAFVVSLVLITDYMVIPALFVPDQLGLLRHMTQEDATTLTIEVPSVHRVEIAQPGTYILFSPDPPPSDHVVLRVAESGKPMSLSRVSAIDLYGTRAIAGVPIGAFFVKQPGAIEIGVQLSASGGSRHTFFVVPDFVSRNQAVILVSCLVHLAIIAIVANAIYYGYNKERLELEAAITQEKRNQLDRWLAREKARGQRATLSGFTQREPSRDELPGDETARWGTHEHAEP